MRVDTLRGENLELVDLRFQELDEFSGGMGAWNLEFVQLDAGPGSVGLTQVSAPGFRLQRFRFDRSYLQRGESPPGMCTLGLVEPRTRGLHMFGREVTDSGIIQFRPGGEFEGVSPPGAECVALSLDANQLEEISEAIGPRRLGRVLDPESGVIGADPMRVQSLWRLVRRLLHSMALQPDGSENLETVEDLTLEIALALQSTDGAEQKESSRIRDHALHRAVAVIEGHLDEPITVQAVCDEVGIGWTSLVRAFRERLGVTPKAYMRTVRLNRVRRDLLQAASGTPIADAANRWGFWHMGQFASDYKRLFGELPSATTSRRCTSRRVLAPPQIPMPAP